MPTPMVLLGMLVAVVIGDTVPGLPLVEALLVT
jgi:hypothetical protein